jgi:hypothetical protein
MSRRAQLADGTVLEFPDGTADDVIDRTVKQHIAPSRVKGTIWPIDQTVSSVNEFLVGIPEGAMNLASTVTDTALRPFVGDEAVRQAQQQRKGAFDAASRALSPREAGGARTAGQIAATLPLAKLKIAGGAAKALPRTMAIANRALQGAFGGAAVRDSGEGAGWNPAIGAAANVVLPPALGALANKIGTSRPAQWLADKVMPLASRGLGAVDDLADDAYNRIAPRVGAKPLQRVNPAVLARAKAPTVAPVKEALGRAAQARLDNFRKAGVKNPTTAMVTRDPRAWTFERETAKAAGTGDELLASFQSVSDDLDRAAQGMIAKRGAADPEMVGIGAQKVLDTKRDEMQKVTGALYKQVREKKGDAAAGTLQNLMDVMDDPDLLDNPKFSVMVDGVTKRLQRMGMTGQSGLVRKGAVANISQAEGLRRLIGELGEGNDPTIRMMRKRMIDALDDSVVDAVGDDAFKMARASARARFEEFGKTFAGKLADSAIAPEQITSRILQKGVRNSDVRALKESFLNGTPDQVARGQEAWKGIGGQALTDIFAKARMADGTLSGARLSKEFTSAAPKLRVLLDPAEYKQIQRIVAAARDSTTAVPFSAVNNSNTSSAVANLFAPEAGGAPVGRKLLGDLAKHGAAFSLGGPTANVGLLVAEGAAKGMAQRKAAEAAIRKVQMAKSPEAAAAAIKAMQAKASRDAAFRAAVKRWQDGGFYTPFSK